MALVPPLDEAEMQADLRDHVQFFKGPLGVIPIRCAPWPTAHPSPAPSPISTSR